MSSFPFRIPTKRLIHHMVKKKFKIRTKNKMSRKLVFQKSNRETRNLIFNCLKNKFEVFELIPTFAENFFATIRKSAPMISVIGEREFCSIVNI